MMPPVIRAYAATLDVSDGDRAVVAKINTDAIDRYGTVIAPEGIDFANYRQNPAVLWMHGMCNDGKPIGRNDWIKYDKKERALIARTIFLEDEYSDGIYRLYSGTDPVLRSFSVNVLPKMSACSSPTAEEIRKRPELAGCWMLYRESELAEYSAVNVPGNPQALALATARGLWMPGEVRAMLAPPATSPAAEVPELPPLVGRTLDEYRDEVIRQIRSESAEKTRIAREFLDLQRGRV